MVQAERVFGHKGTWKDARRCERTLMDNPNSYPKIFTSWEFWGGAPCLTRREEVSTVCASADGTLR
jgi:hypothetical protein